MFIGQNIILVIIGNKINIKIIPTLKGFMISLKRGHKINIRNFKISNLFKKGK